MPSFLQRLGAALRGNPLDNPSVPLNSGAGFLYELFGGTPTDAGVAVNEKVALAHTTVYACISVLASAFRSMPWVVYEVSGKTKKPALDTDLYHLLAVEPNPEMSAPTFWSAMMACAALRGNAYAIIQRDPKNPKGVPLALWPIHPSHVKLKRVNKVLSYVVTVDGAETSYAPSDIFHVPALTMDGLVGIDPLTSSARQSIGTSVAAARHVAGFFGRGSRPSGMLVRTQAPTPTGTMARSSPEDNDKLRSSWEAANAAGNQGRTAVLPYGWEWKAISITPEQAQYLQIRSFERADLAALWSIPPHMVGDTSRLSNSNHESISLEFLKFTMLPWIVAFEAEANRKIVPRIGRNSSRYVAKTDPSEIIRGDFDAQMTAFAVGRQWGILTADECREVLGYDPLGGVAGTEALIPLNMVAASRLLDEPITPEAEPGSGDDGSDGDGTEPKGNGGQNQRKLLQRVEDAYRRLFRDAAGRLQSRSTRDAAAVQQTFGAVLASIAEEAERQARGFFRLAADADLGTEKLLRDTTRQLEKRTASWTATTVDADADRELRYCVRAITLHVYREAGSTHAQAA